MNRFGGLDATKYPEVFQQFLNEMVNYSISRAESNFGKYIASWVVNKSNPMENMVFEWKGEALVQDAIHDSGRALGDWQTTAIEPLKSLWGLSPDVDFEQIKQGFLASMATEPIEVNSIIVPSTLDQGDVISPFLPTDCIHTFDNGAMKAPQFGKQYVTQATIYDTGNAVNIKGNVMFFPPTPDDFQHFGTLTITVMPTVLNIGNRTENRMQVFVIFSHGRFITETNIGIEGFMQFFDAQDMESHPVSLFNESSLNANIGPVSKGEYLNNGKLQSASYGFEMPNYFAEIIKFIADRNQCIMSGYFSNLPNNQIERFYGGTGVNKLMLVSGDRYSLDEIYRFMKENGVYIPFTYFGASRFEKHYKRYDDATFQVVSTASRCLFSVRQKGNVTESPEMRAYMSQIRELTNLIEKTNELSARLEIDLKIAKMEIVSLNNRSNKRARLSEELYERAKTDLKRIRANARLMQTIKERIHDEAVDRLSLSYQEWAAHEEYERETLAKTEEFKRMDAQLIANAELIKRSNDELENIRGNLLKEQDKTKEESTSVDEFNSEGNMFNNTTRVIDTIEGPRMQDVLSGYIYEKDEPIMTLQESIDRQRKLEDPDAFAREQQHRGGMKRTAKNRRFNYPRKNIDGWMIIDFFKNIRRPQSKLVRKTRRSIKKVKPASPTTSKSKRHKKRQMNRKKITSRR